MERTQETYQPSLPHESDPLSSPFENIFADFFSVYWIQLSSSVLQIVTLVRNIFEVWSIQGYIER